jgi:hypothetical protein
MMWKHVAVCIVCCVWRFQVGFYLRTKVVPSFLRIYLHYSILSIISMDGLGVSVFRQPFHISYHPVSIAYFITQLTAVIFQHLHYVLWSAILHSAAALNKRMSAVSIILISSLTSVQHLDTRKTHKLPHNSIICSKGIQTTKMQGPNECVQEIRRGPLKTRLRK